MKRKKIKLEIFSKENGCEARLNLLESGCGARPNLLGSSLDVATQPDLGVAAKPNPLAL
jgi:hypothetical protein